MHIGLREGCVGGREGWSVLLGKEGGLLLYGGGGKEVVHDHLVYHCDGGGRKRRAGSVHGMLAP